MLIWLSGHIRLGTRITACVFLFFCVSVGLNAFTYDESRTQSRRRRRRQRRRRTTDEPCV